MVLVVLAFFGDLVGPASQALYFLFISPSSSMKATITEISDGTDVDLWKGRDEEVLEMLVANPKVR